MSLFKEAFRFCEMTQKSFVKFAVANLSVEIKRNISLVRNGLKDLLLNVLAYETQFVMITLNLYR